MTAEPRESRAAPAEPSQLINVERLLATYYDTRPDPIQASQRVAFGTSGHRGSALYGAFNEDHIAAVVEARCATASRRASTARSS